MTKVISTGDIFPDSSSEIYWVKRGAENKNTGNPLFSGLPFFLLAMD
jgi:hypothetical protein